MSRNSSTMIDNRDSEQMYTYYEARIDALKRRVAELEEANRVLSVAPNPHNSARCNRPSCSTAVPAFSYAGYGR